MNPQLDLQVNFRNSEFIHSFVSTFYFLRILRNILRIQTLYISQFWTFISHFWSLHLAIIILFSATVYIYIIEFRPYEIYFYISQLPFSPQNVFFIFIIVLESVLIFFF